MNPWWLILTVGILGALVGLTVMLWPLIEPLAPDRPAGKLLALLDTWAGVRDLSARVALRRSGEHELEVRLLYLSNWALRADLLAPEEVAGEIYALRPVPDGWLLVHYRPRIDLGIETRLTSANLEALLPTISLDQLRLAVRLGQVKVTAPEEGTLEVQGRLGAAHRVLLRLEETTGLPREIVLFSAQGDELLHISILELTINPGVELRDLLSLDPLPGQWLRPGLTPPGA
ncbi:MAG: hypothetical protein NUV94_06295 [Candidatus Acetothermia bacterium]|jgi:hypothetical protein|nr:hypothetical protein [Candidatus Acetothermia bacterium]